MIPRTTEEIKTRLEEMKKVDMFGFSLGDLMLYLPELLDEEDKKNAETTPPTEEKIIAEIVKYLPFAFDKALGHRGLSANRSVMHLANWAWFLRRDDLLAFADSSDNYRNYGVPILKKFAMEFGVAMPPRIENWKDGEACTAGCDNGCNQ